METWQIDEFDSKFVLWNEVVIENKLAIVVYLV